VCGINDPGHTCDEYLVLLVKSGMTCDNWKPAREEEQGDFGFDDVESSLQGSSLVANR
jgi:hypothetical protein